MKSSIRKLMKSTGMIETISTVSPQHCHTPTHIRGSKIIDGIITSSSLKETLIEYHHISLNNILYTDHIGIITTLKKSITSKKFSKSIPYTKNNTTNNPIDIIKYNKTLIKLIEKQNIFKKMDKLKNEFKNNPQSVELERRFNSIDKHITESQIKAEKYKEHISPFPWSPIVKHVYLKLLFLNKLVKRSPYKITINNFNKCIKYT